MEKIVNEWEEKSSFGDSGKNEEDHDELEFTCVG